MNRTRKIGIWMIALLFVFGVFLHAPKAEAAGESDDETQYQIVQVKTYQYQKLAFDVLDIINDRCRKDEWELTPFVMDKDLMVAAMQRAAECAVYNDGYKRPSGEPFSTVSKKAKAENTTCGPLGDGASVDDPSGWWHKAGDAVHVWTRIDANGEHSSSGKNLYDPEYKSIGVGVCVCNGDSYWVVLFGDKVDSKKVVTRESYAPKDRVVKYPKIKISTTYLKNGTISATLNPKVPSSLQVGKTAKISLRFWQETRAGYSATAVNSKLKFMSSKSAVATVSDKGVITAVSPGTAYITIRSKFTNTAAPAPSLMRFKVVVKTKTTSGPAISRQPDDAYLNVGQQATFLVRTSASGVKYQWYYRKTETGSWTAVSAASGKTNTYILTTKERHDGYQYRCQLKNSSGTTYSKIVTLRFIPRIISTPGDQVLSAGDTMELTVAAKGSNLSYQWYYVKPGEYTGIKTTNASGKTPTYTIKVAQRHNGYQYYCVISNEAGEQSTYWIKLTVQ